MRSPVAVSLTLASCAGAVLGFDLVAALVTRSAHVAYVDFMLPDLALFATIGFVLMRRLRSTWNALFFVAFAALTEATAGRALATQLAAEGPPPGTSAAFLALETVVVAAFMSFWGAIGIAASAILPKRR